MDRQRLDYTPRPRTPLRSDIFLSHLEDRYVDSTKLSLSQKCLYAVFISFVELYNDVIFDLLDDSTECGRYFSATLFFFIMKTSFLI